MKIFLNILFMYFVLNYCVLAQHEVDTITNISIDTNIITTNIIDTIKQDTIIYYDFSNYRGSILLLNDSINYKNIPNSNYFFTTDLITQNIPTNPLFTTITGNYSAFSIFGSFPNENICMLGGVCMSDFYGNANFDFISPEIANNIEIIYGSNAAIKTGKSGMAVNIQPFIYNTSKPYSKIWYAQGDNKLIGVDGIYSQNFLPNWNITGGFKRISSNSYYHNSFYDMWNARLMLSLQQSNQSVFSLLYHFTNFHTGDFGGILFNDYNKINTSASQVRSNFSTLTDRQYKTDLIFLHSYHSIDTNIIINSNIFLNNLENNIYYGKDSSFIALFGDSTERDIASIYNYGINTNIKYNLFNFLSINAGAEICSNNIPNTLLTKDFNGFGYNIFGIGIFNFSSTTISLGSRYGQKYEKNIFSIGGNVTQKIIEQLFINADISLLKTDPIPVLDYHQENHLLLIGGINYDAVVNLNLFLRHINDQLILLDNTILPERKIDDNLLFGMNIKGNIALPYNFKAIIMATDYVDKISKSNTFYTTLSLEYTHSKNNQDVLTFGLNGTLLQSENKYYFLPFIKNYFRTDLNEGLECDGLSVYIKAKLGNCYLRATFRNILGLTYSYLAYYPMLKQEFNLSLTWAFP